MAAKQTNNVIVVLVTCASQREAQKIVRALVEKRLAACGNVFPADVKSIYRWKGKINTARETLLILKTTRKQFAKLERKFGGCTVTTCLRLSRFPLSLAQRRICNGFRRV